MPKILRNNGVTVDAADFLDIARFQQKMLSPHVSWAEAAERDANGNKRMDGEFTIAEKLLEAFEALRAVWGQPIQINSGWRSKEKQAALRADSSYKAALYSPHQEGLAFDLNCDSIEEVDRMVSALRTLRDRFPVRIGWQQYRDNGQCFVHFDVAPWYYGKSGPFAGNSCPDAWREPCEW